MSQAKPVTQRLDAAIQSGMIRPDPAQREIALALDSLAAELSQAASAPKRLFTLVKPKQTSPAGLYLWGDVGRGKSMLMDMFVASISPTQKTRRVHFHRFMLDVHKRLFAFRQVSSADVMARVIDELARDVRVLCLDEFQVTDVTDAMILARLFSGLMDAGVTVLFTSNRAPRDLYQGGLQRDQFLKFVDILEARLPILSLDSPHDYRLAQLRAMKQTYFHPLGDAADDFLLDSWRALTHDEPSDPLWLDVEGRTLRIDRHASGICWLTFDELCRRPLGANDYLELTRCCHTVLLQGIPKMTAEDRNEAKRFVTLIDAMYDHRIKLIATAGAAPDDLYPSGDGSFEFHRTASRLHEMQSETYLALAHIA